MEQKPETVPTLETARKLGLLPEEFERIAEILGRKPNFTELSIFSVMWSEHCSYKNSITWLKTLPRESERMLVKAGEENAGLVDIGGGLACSFKIESHNHPSALEPYQGAATGVGGINRDIFTMGARPIAQLNSLRFGNPALEKTRHLLKGVVKGIGDYGNAFGVPTVGGELYFDECYNVNPLVNAFSAGIVEVGKVAKATAYGVGNPVYIVGSATGKDGIHGATFASEDISDKSTEKLPAVQVGDPFQEKLLLEASLEVIATGKVIGIQDMGAAGIICSTSEMSAKGEHGMEIWLDKVPARQENMQPFELLLSESQERMLVVVKKGAEAEIQAIFDKWDLNCAQIGTVTAGGRLHFFMQGHLVADVPAHDLVLGGGAPVYTRTWSEPAYFNEYQQFKPETVPQPDYKAVAAYLLQHPNIASRKWITRQYDSMVGVATLSTNFPSDAALVHIKGTSKAIAICVDCNGRYVQADPKTGAAIAVAEACRNIVCSGGVPLAVTNNLNFGNPYNPEVYWAFVNAVQGMGDACRHFGTPVTGGNVSFYNQSADGGAVFPTPTIGMLGLLENLDTRMSLHFKNPGNLVYLLGKPQNDIACSEYLYSYLGIKKSPAPYYNPQEELLLHQAITAIIAEGRVLSVHDVSDGGLYVTLAEAALPGNLGFSIQTDPAFRKDAYLFGEAQGRAVASITGTTQAAFEERLTVLGLSFTLLGTVESTGFSVDGELWSSTAAAAEAHSAGLEKALGIIA